MEKQTLGVTENKIYVKDLDVALSKYEELGFYLVESRLTEINERAIYLMLADCCKSSFYLKNFRYDEMKRCLDLLIIEDREMQPIDFNQIEPPDKWFLIAFQ